jgi:hypothetical protein
MSWFFKTRPPLRRIPVSGMIEVEKEGEREILSAAQWEALTGAILTLHLDFSDVSLMHKIEKKIQTAHQKERLGRNQLWWGSYFKQEILNPALTSSFRLQWIDSQVGWGVFAARLIKKMEWIGEYTGKVRKRKNSDKKNAYCFEYLIAQGEDSPYVVDAQEQGSLVRYINHSLEDNLTSTLATCNGCNHIILFAKQPIPAGAQLFYDYGPNYWAHRADPKKLI